MRHSWRPASSCLDHFAPLKPERANKEGACAVSGLSEMEAIESIASLEISTATEAFARPLLVGRGLTKVYRNGPFEVRALDGVDIDLYSGEIVVLLGESGSGKSTLLNSLWGVSMCRRPDRWLMETAISRRPVMMNSPAFDVISSASFFKLTI
jgi:ABC-type glutathione transport system ATPase component